MPVGKTPSFLWLKGQPVPWSQAMVHISELGQSTVSSVFEGIRGYWNPEHGRLYLFRLQEHIERFVQSLRLVRSEPPHTAAEMVQGCLDLLRVNDLRESTYLKPMSYLEPKPGSARLFSQGDDTAAVMITTSAFTTALTNPDRALHACISSWLRISEQAMPPRIKCISNYHNGRLASAEVRLNGYDNAILLNTLGHVTETPGSCIMLFRKGVAITPAISSGILESITRDTLIRILRDDMGIEVQERPVDRTELYISDELITCGTSVEIAPFISVDRIPVGSGKVGPITKELQRRYYDIVMGSDSRYESWRTVVSFAESGVASV